MPEPNARPRLMATSREHDLRRRIAARDQRALAELIDTCAPWLLGIAHGMLQDQDEAEEIVLDTFRLAWEKIEPPSATSRGIIAWLLQVTRNRAIDRLRARRRRSRLLDRVRPELDHAVAATEPNEAATPGWHVHREVHAALDELGTDQRNVVQLAYFEGRTHSEIAQLLDIPLGTVKTRLRLGLGKLRVALSSLKEWV